MDTSDPNISFYQGGVCNHCNDYESVHKKEIYNGTEGESKLRESLDAIKNAGKGKEYDCVLGLSGGVDSTYVAYLARQYGLRPLVVHLDNGWNSELAVNNIKQVIKKLKFDYMAIVIDWEEFRDIQLAYLKASVIDIEAITDHAIIAALHKVAAENKVKYIVSGSNLVTEAILPSAWIHNKMDGTNVKAIHKEYGTKPLKTYPIMDVVKHQYYQRVLKITTIPILDYIPYIKEEVKQLITDKLKWRDYGGKHYESIFTRFYQGYILPTKFGVDKRRAHLSTLICSEQITREEALEELKAPIYNLEQLAMDKEFVLKKFGFTEQEFKEIMDLPVRRHRDFATASTIYDQHPILKIFKPLRQLLKGR